MRQVLSDQRLRSHACLVETLEATGKNAPASVELYALGRQAKTHVIVQQLCEVRRYPVTIKDSVLAGCTELMYRRMPSRPLLVRRASPALPDGKTVR